MGSCLSKVEWMTVTWQLWAYIMRARCEGKHCLFMVPGSKIGLGISGLQRRSGQSLA